MGRTLEQITSIDMLKIVSLLNSFFADSIQKTWIIE